VGEWVVVVENDKHEKTTRLILLYLHGENLTTSCADRPTGRIGASSRP